MALNVTAHRGESVSRRSGTLAERYNRGVSLRRKIPRKKHADLLGPADRDPVAILAAGDRTRVPELIPVRYERMLTSPFAFLRGAAAVMAQDLRHQPATEIAIQACGDCHLMNFGPLLPQKKTFCLTSMISTRRCPASTSRSTSRGCPLASRWLRWQRSLQTSGHERPQPRLSKP